MVESAERFDFSSLAGCDDGIGGACRGGGDQKTKPGGGDARHVAGEDECPAAASLAERGLDAAERPAAGEAFREDRQSEMTVLFGPSDQRDVAGGGQGLLGDVLDESGAFEGKERFVPAHPAAHAAGQHESRHPHDTMVAVQPVRPGDGRSRGLRRFPLWKGRRTQYNQKNIVLSICLLLPVATALAAEPAARITSTVRADPRTGRLVRRTVALPLPATGKAARAAAIRADQAASREVAAARVGGSAVAVAVQAGGDVNSAVEELARTHNVDPLLVHSVIKAESNYNPAAISPKGAMGLMQLMPGTARRFGVSNTFDVRQNIEAGVKYLKHLQQMFQDNRLALAAYNAGEGAVLKYGDVPPYRETEEYVYKVGKSYGEALRRGSQASRPAALSDAAAPAAGTPAVEPLRQLEIARDEEGRVVLRTR